MRKLLLICVSIFIMIDGYSQKMIYEFESFMGVSNNYNTSISTGFRENIGFTLSSSIRLKNNTYFQVGLGYDLNGYTFHESYNAFDGSFDVDTKISHNYLTIPVYIRFSNLGAKGKLRIRTGIYYSYMFSKIHEQNGYSEPFGEERVVVHTKVNRSDDIINLGRNDFGFGLDIARTIVTFGGIKLDLGLYSKIGMLATIKPDLSKNYSFGIIISLTKGSKK